MAIYFVSLIFIWLLPLTASGAVTSGQNNNFTNVMTATQETRNMFTHGQLITQEASSINPLSEVSQSVIADVNPTEEEATKPSTKPSLQTTLTPPSKRFLPGIQTAATPTYSTASEINSSTLDTNTTTEVQFNVTISATVGTSHASIPTTTTRVPSMPSSSTQSQFTSYKPTHPSTRPPQSTNLSSTAITSTKPVENKSLSTSHVTDSNPTQSTGLYKTLMATTKTPIIHITKAKGRQDPPDKKANGTTHSKVVAGLIGGALVFMMVGFLIIYIKKRKLQSQQITTRDWAGPSPFLEGGADNGGVTLRSSNRISLSSFLPQRLSKRLSMLQETDEELEDMSASTFGREVDGKDVQERNGTSGVVPEMKSTGDAPETLENSVSVTSETNNVPHVNNNSEVVKHSQDLSANPPTSSEAQLNDGVGQT